MSPAVESVVRQRLDFLRSFAAVAMLISSTAYESEEKNGEKVLSDLGWLTDPVPVALISFFI